MDLSNVPFFQRPMSASKTDKPTGNMDEAGNVEYISKTGQTYFIKPSADQRTTRTKIEEDVVPALKDFAANPSLPSADQMKQFGMDAVQGTYEGIKGAVEGTGTMGDVFGVVPTMAALGAGAEVPEGAIRLFGGKKATSPGQTRSGANAPESVGADTMYRFEIDDSSSYVAPSNIKAIDSKDLTVFPSSPPSTLADAFVHDELFFQYPELKDIGFVSDTSLGAGTYGYYAPNKGLIAVNPSLLQPENSDLLRKTLLHEIQHALQHREGFTQGTDPDSIEVAMVGPKLINSPENKAEWDNYEQQIKKFEDPKNLEFTLQKISDLASAIAEKEGYQISEPGFFQRLKTKFLGGKELSTAEQNLIKFSNELNFLREKAVNSDPKYFNYYLGRVDSLFSGVKSLAGPKSEGVFQEVLGLSPAELKNKKGSNLFLDIPKLPDLPAPGTTQAEDWVFHTIYQRKKGEAEARNAAERMDLSLEERFNQTPESTEDVPRNLQWDESTYTPTQKYNQGGSVTMDKQMKLFQEGGIADDGMSRDPVSGNEVPPGSLSEEVRDDVDAKLSEGEYVVPADVVRFFGVDYFEKLRKKAKEGLAQMDADGRIGGEPVPEEPEDDLPFSDDELMAMDEPEAEAPVGMAEGGSVKSTFNPADYAAGFSANAASGGSSSVTGVENKTYINKDGAQRVIMFVNGQPIQQIPAGFVEATPENKVELTKQQVSGNIPAGEVVTETSEGPDNVDAGRGFNATTGTTEDSVGTPMSTAGTMAALGAQPGKSFSNAVTDAITNLEGKDIGKAAVRGALTGGIPGVVSSIVGTIGRNTIKGMQDKGPEMAEAGDTFGKGETGTGGRSGGAEEFGGPGDGGVGFGGAEGGPSESAGVGSGGVGPGGMGLWNKGGYVKRPASKKISTKPENKGLVKRKSKK
jgi:hypothetical protein